jgi:protein SCO1
MVMRMSRMGGGRSRTRSWVLGGVMVALVTAGGWYAGSLLSESSDPEEGAGEAATKVYRDIAGRVMGVDAEAGVLKVHHERIEGLMEAMVMDLKVAEWVDLGSVEAGDRIRFDLAVVRGTYEVVAVRPYEAGGSRRAQGDPRYATPEDPLGRGDLIPDLELYDQGGRSFRLRDMEQRHKLITFFYVRCPLQQFCPAQSARLRELQTELEERGSDVHLLSLSLDSDHDQADVLVEYAGRFDADPDRWTLAGGKDPEAVRDFAHRVGAGAQRQDDGFQVDHALLGLYVDGHRIVDRVYGLQSLTKMARGL